MSIHFVSTYWIGLVGGAVGFVVGMFILRLLERKANLAIWDARIALPLLLAAAGAHLSLIAVVETQRQVLFGLYGVALIGVILFALLGFGIWRLGAVVFPLGSIGAYVYFALLVHQVDYIGLVVKLVEVAAIVAAVVSVSRGRESSRSLATSA
ncbi:MAG TPA: hypothetical protein VKE27_10730 [Candidatus Dormibacteraeota bacterium]|nr:hypothetical protein [Candidatus Dormibacteraeota bacterium]